MEIIKPRFEFRTFALNLNVVEDMIRKISKRENIRESEEIYIISAMNDINNIKIRNDLMDIKVLIQEYQGLEQWNPVMKEKFPMSSDILEKEVFPALNVVAPEFKRDSYTLQQFLEELISSKKELVPVNVFKKRYGFDINKCITELADIWINEKLIRTAAIESTIAEDIIETRKLLSLDKYENINYLKAIKRIIWMKPFPNR